MINNGTTQLATAKQALNKRQLITINRRVKSRKWSQITESHKLNWVKRLSITKIKTTKRSNVAKKTGSKWNTGRIKSLRNLFWGDLTISRAFFSTQVLTQADSYLWRTIYTGLTSGTKIAKKVFVLIQSNQNVLQKKMENSFPLWVICLRRPACALQFHFSVSLVPRLLEGAEKAWNRVRTIQKPRQVTSHPKSPRTTGNEAAT